MMLHFKTSFNVIQSLVTRMGTKRKIPKIESIQTISNKIKNTLTIFFQDAA